MHLRNAAAFIGVRERFTASGTVFSSHQFGTCFNFSEEAQEALHCGVIGRDFVENALLNVVTNSESFIDSNRSYLAANKLRLLEYCSVYFQAALY